MMNDKPQASTTGECRWHMTTTGNCYYQTPDNTITIFRKESMWRISVFTKGKGVKYSKTKFHVQEDAIEKVCNFFHITRPDENALKICVKQGITLGNFGDGVNLKCPVCGDNYSHIREVYTAMGGDEGHTYEGTIVKEHVNERRSALVIVVDGEACGHYWKIIIQQHKGVNEVSVEAFQLAYTDPNIER